MSYVLQGDGRQTVTTPGTEVALGTDTNCAYVLVQAETDNSGVIAVGKSTVNAGTPGITDRRGLILAAGEVATIFADNLADIFIDASVGTDGVTYIYYT